MNASPGNRIEIAGVDLVFRGVPCDDVTPSGRQLAHLAGFAPDEHVYVLQVRDDDQVEDVRASEAISLADGRRFVVAPSDRSYRLAMDGNAMDWPSRFVTAATLRRLLGVPVDKVIYLVRTDEPDRRLAEDDIVDLDELGVETFRQSKAPTAKEQNVQVKHLGELEVAKLRVSETTVLRRIWELAYEDLQVEQDPRDVFQAEVQGRPVGLMDHLDLTLGEAQGRGLARRVFEIAARTGGA